MNIQHVTDHIYYALLLAWMSQAVISERGFGLPLRIGELFTFLRDAYTGRVRSWKQRRIFIPPLFSVWTPLFCAPCWSFWASAFCLYCLEGSGILEAIGLGSFSFVVSKVIHKYI